MIPGVSLPILSRPCKRWMSIIAQGEMERALQALDELRSTAELGRRFGRLIEAHPFRALAYQKQKRGDLAPETLASFEHSLELAGPEGYILLFLEEGPAVMALLKAVAHHGCLEDRSRTRAIHSRGRGLHSYQESAREARKTWRRQRKGEGNDMARIPIAVRRWIADAVSLSRLVLLIAWIWCEIVGSVWTLPTMAGIIASDLFDGPIARKLSTASGRGALLDALCDALVVVAAAATLGLKDVRYFGLAGLMAAAFISWGSYSLVIGRFAYTRLGKYNGVICYALVAAADARPWFATLGVRAPAVGEWIVISAVVALLGGSAVENIVGTLQAVTGMKGGRPRLATSREQPAVKHRTCRQGRGPIYA